MVDGISVASDFNPHQALEQTPPVQGAASPNGLRENATESPVLAPLQIQLQAGYSALGIANKIPETILGAIVNVIA